jgi:hypothetical protein
VLLAVTGAQSWKSPFAQNRLIAPKTFNNHVIGAPGEIRTLDHLFED